MGYRGEHWLLFFKGILSSPLLPFLYTKKKKAENSCRLWQSFFSVAPSDSFLSFTSSKRKTRIWQMTVTQCNEGKLYKSAEYYSSCILPFLLLHSMRVGGLNCGEIGNSSLITKIDSTEVHDLGVSSSTICFWTIVVSEKIYTKLNTLACCFSFLDLCKDYALEEKAGKRSGEEGKERTGQIGRGKLHQVNSHFVSHSVFSLTFTFTFSSQKLHTSTY